MLTTASPPFPQCYGPGGGLCHSTTLDPTAPYPGNWTRYGVMWPGKSAALLIRPSPPHYLYQGDSSIRLWSTDDLYNYTLLNNSFIAPRPGSFDSELVEAGPPPLRLSDGNYVFFHNSAENPGGYHREEEEGPPAAARPSLRDADCPTAAAAAAQPSSSFSTAPTRRRSSSARRRRSSPRRASGRRARRRPSATCRTSSSSRPPPPSRTARPTRLTSGSAEATPSSGRRASRSRGCEKPGLKHWETCARLWGCVVSSQVLPTGCLSFVGYPTVAPAASAGSLLHTAVTRGG